MQTGRKRRRDRMVKLSRHIDARKVGWFLVATVFYSLFFQALYNMLKYDSLLPYSGVDDFALSFWKNFIPIFLLGILNVAIVFRLPLPEWLEKRILPKAAVDLVVSLGGLLAVNSVYLWVMGSLSAPSAVHVAGTVLSDILILLFVEVAYYVCLSRELDRKASALRDQAAEYRYDALKSQINPHFLFNSLNILYSLIDLDKEKSKEFVLSLTSVYRHVLSFRNRSVVTVEEELELLKSYVEVLSMRYHNQFFVDVVYECPEVLRRQVIPFSLQLLVENVTKHNEVSSVRPMRVCVTVGATGITVANPVCPRRSAGSSGVGLHYIEQQYQRYGKSMVLNRTEQYFTAIVPYL